MSARPAPLHPRDIAAATEIPLGEVLRSVVRRLRPGLALGLAAAALVGAMRLVGSGDGAVLPLPEDRVSRAVESGLHADLVLAQAWKARGVDEVLAPSAEASVRHGAAMALVQAILARANDPLSGPLSQAAQAFMKAGHVEAQMGLWSVERLDAWAAEIAALDQELPRAIRAAEARLAEGGLRPSRAGSLARRLAIDLAIEVRGVAPGERGRAESLTPDEAVEAALVRAVQDAMRASLLPHLAAVVAPERDETRLALLDPPLELPVAPPVQPPVQAGDDTPAPRGDDTPAPRGDDTPAPLRADTPTP